MGRTHGTSCSAGTFGLAELGVCALFKTYLEQLAIGELISRTSFRAPTLNPITPPGVLPTQAGGARGCAAVTYELTGSYAAAVISTVPPGCYAIARDGGVRVYPYWDWEIPTAEQMRGDRRSDAEIVDEFREALRGAVRRSDLLLAHFAQHGQSRAALTT